MTAIDSLIVFKIVLLTGLAAWTLMSVFNNLMAFGAGVGALGRLMGMQLFEQDPPIRTPLPSRRVSAAALVAVNVPGV